MTEPDRIVDARGLLCPWPVLRLSRAARELGGAGRILLLADDPAAATRGRAALRRARLEDRRIRQDDAVGYLVLVS